MTPLNIAVVVGSIRKASINARLAAALQAIAPAGLGFHPIRIDDLPHYNNDDEAAPPPQVQRLRDEVRRADGVLFVTPEYNRSIPGVLKNAIDLASRPYGKNAWAGKPAGVIGASPGALGTGAAQQHLRNVLAYLDMPTLGQPEAFIQVDAEFFDAAGGVARDANREFLAQWMGRYADWVRRHAQNVD